MNKGFLNQNSGCFFLALIFLGATLLGGCGGRAAQMPPSPVVAQIDSQSKQNRLQEQLTRKGAPLSPSDSRNYTIGSEDLLAVNFLEAEKLQRDVRVDGEGKISLLLIGEVQVAGLTPAEVERKLSRLYEEGGFLRNPQINVAVKEYCHQKVAVTGAVKEPDHYALIGPRSLLEVLGMAGGLSEEAGEVVHIIRAPHKAAAIQTATRQQSFSPGTETIVVDLNRLLLQGKVELNYSIQNGDVVHVPFARTAYVLGAVSEPGPVLLKDNMTVTKAVAATGGLHKMLRSYNATLLRLNDQGQRENIPVNLRHICKGGAQDIPLKENDIVFVHEGPMRRFFFDFKMMFPGSFGMSVPAML